MNYGKIREQFETGFLSYQDFMFYVEIILENEEDEERIEYIKSDLEEMFS